MKQPIDVLPDLTDTTLVGAWLNKAVQNRGDDYGTYGNDGTPTDVTWDEAGGVFNGSSAYIDIADTDSEWHGSAITVCGWVKSDLLAQRYIIGEGGRFRIGRNVTGGWYVWFKDSGGTNRITGVGTFESDRWYHFAFTVEGSVEKFYIDGVKEEEQAYDIMASGSNNQAIGTGFVGDANYWSGEVKMLAVYSEAKSADWVANEYARSVPDNSLVFHTNDGIEDLSRYGSPVAVNGVPIVGKGIKFNGASDHIDLSKHFDASDIPVFTGGFSIECLIKPDDGQPASDERFFGSQNATAQDLIQAFIDSTGFIRFTVKSDNDQVNCDTGVVLSNGQEAWHHVLMTAEQNGGNIDMVVYVDGESEGTQSGVCVLADFVTDANLYLGARNNNGTADSHFAGEINAFKIFNEVKTADYAKAEYLRTRGRC